MKVAWVSHHTLFQDVIGGAEMADESMILRAPDDLDIRTFGRGWIGS